MAVLAARIQTVPAGCPCGGDLMVSWSPGRSKIVRNAVVVEVAVSSAMCASCGQVIVVDETWKDDGP